MKCKINNNSYFIYSEELDLIFLTVGILCDKVSSEKYSSLYDDNFINKIKNKYKLVSEILCSLNNCGLGILEHLLIYKKEFLNLDEYEEFLLSLNKDLLFYKFFGEYVDMDTIHDALSNDEALNKLFNDYNISSNYLTMKYLISNTDEFISSFFECVKALKTPEFTSYIKSKDTVISKQKELLEKKLGKEDSLTVSQNIMGKSFYNRGPYSKFTFMPSFMLPIKHIRYFDINNEVKQQILFYTFHNEKNKEDVVNMLKVLGDETRFKIIELLSSGNPQNGRELAASLNIATSTISHHMDLLKSVGLINEERNKNSKYYTLNSNTSKELIKYLEHILINER